MHHQKNPLEKKYSLCISARWIAMICILPMLAMANFVLAQAADGANFNHIQTGFNLVGPHRTAPCESCHVQGVFKGTPRNCASCHTIGNRMGAATKPNTHIPTAAACDKCHRPTTWVPATYSHVGVAPATCLTCHNNMTATGKPNGHILTTASCDTCHRTIAWIPAGYNHTGIAPGTCATCHGVTATGKPAGHISTTESCDKCHSTRAWLPAHYDHTGILPGTCTTCHNGATAKGVGGSPTTRHPAYSGHVPTSRWPSCDICHKSTASFRNARVHGSGASVTGQCNICHRAHNDSQSCDRCHSTSTWGD